MTRRLASALALGSLLSYGVLVACTGDDDVLTVPLPPNPQSLQDAATQGSSSSSSGEADADVDAQTPLTSCTECMTGTCGEQILGCVQDAPCRDLMLCAVQNNCFDDPMSCLQTCAQTDGGGLDAETLAQLMNMAQLVQSCGPCLDSCRDVLGQLGSSSGSGGLGSSGSP